MYKLHLDVGTFIWHRVNTDNKISMFASTTNNNENIENHKSTNQRESNSISSERGGMHPLSSIVDNYSQVHIMLIWAEIKQKIIDLESVALISNNYTWAIPRTLGKEQAYCSLPQHHGNSLSTPLPNHSCNLFPIIEKHG